MQVVNRGREARCGIDTDKKVGPAAMSVKPLPMGNIKQYQPIPVKPLNHTGLPIGIISQISETNQPLGFQ